MIIVYIDEYESKYTRSWTNIWVKTGQTCKKKKTGSKDRKRKRNYTFKWCYLLCYRTSDNNETGN